MASLAGKVAIVTGSSRGIGRAIGERLADDVASVVTNYNRSADEARHVVTGIEAKGGKAIAIQADCSAVSDIRRLFRDAIAKFGGVDIVVNNAGSEGGGPVPIAQASEEQFDLYMSGFVRGPFFVMQEAARHIRDRGRSSTSPPPSQHFFRHSPPSMLARKRRWKRSPQSWLGN